MADTVDKIKRSSIMRAVPRQHTKPEVAVRKYLFHKGFRYKLHDKSLPGTPDIVLPKYKVAIFVNGCFWHGHDNCKKASLPKTNSEFWASKVNKNKFNDDMNASKLISLGWVVKIIWGCELANKKFDKTLETLCFAIEDQI